MLNSPDIQLCLLSPHIVGNITPALDPSLSPDEVILLMSSEMEGHATGIEAVLRPRGIRVSRWLVDVPWDIEHLRDRVLDLLVEHAGNNIVLNVSGGDRPMGIAAYEVFRADGRPIFYVHPEMDRVVWLHPNERPGFDLEDRIKLRDFLLVHGAEIKAVDGDQGVPEPLCQLTEELVRDVENFSAPLSALNWLASRAESSLKSPPLSDRQRGWDALQALIQMFEDHGLINLLPGGQLQFPNEMARFFINGGWLEYHVHGLLHGLRSEISIQDLARGIEVTRRTSRGDPVRNEIDVAFLSDNRLHVIECKTSRFNGREDDDGPGAEALYKLDTVKDLLGGAQGRAMLVSYRPLSKYDRQRASDLGIQICVGGELRELRSRLERWIMSGGQGRAL